MNYLAHGLRFLDEPWALAGAALPDWLRVIDKHARLRGDVLDRVDAEPGSRAADLVRGARAHHDDDLWFHTLEVFEAQNDLVTADIRARFPGDKRLRASTLGHIVVEMLLDAALMAKDPTALPRYYSALDILDAHELQTLLRAWTGRPLDHLPELLDRFRRALFLYSYRTDDGLCDALDGVLWRTGLPELPAGFSAVVADARPRVAALADLVVERMRR